MSAPEFHLVLGLEAAPRLVWVADRDVDLERLLDWLQADVKLSRLLALARTPKRRVRELTAAEVAPIYARRGWAVLPLQPRGKLPITEHGSLDATHDPKVIAGWFATSPDCNIGIATGTISGLHVVDLDGDAGVATWRKLLRTHGAAPTLTATTGSGGFHLFYATDEIIGNTAKKLGPGIDTRGQGGYVVAVPSRHPRGGSYRWSRLVPVVPAPAWLVERLSRREPAPRPITTHGSVFQPSGYGEEMLARLCHGMATTGAGARNDTLNRAAWTAGLLVARGQLDGSDCELQLVAAAVAAGLPEREARATFTSGFNAGFRKGGM